MPIIVICNTLTQMVIDQSDLVNQISYNVSVDNKLPFIYRTCIWLAIWTQYSYGQMPPLHHINENQTPPPPPQAPYNG